MPEVNGNLCEQIALLWQVSCLEWKHGIEKPTKCDHKGKLRKLGLFPVEKERILWVSVLKDYFNVQESVRRRIMIGLFSDSSGGLKLQGERDVGQAAGRCFCLLWHHTWRQISRTGCSSFLEGAWGMFDPTPALGRDRRTC